MGSTLETSIILSVVIVVICAFVLFPLEVCSNTYDDCKSFSRELDNYYRNHYNAQDFNYMVTGLSENYRLIYGTLGDILNEEG